ADYPELMTEIPDAVLAAVRSGRLPAQRLQDAARRTATLASLEPGSAGVEAGVEPEGGPAEVARRCVEVRGALPRLERPLVIECRTENGMATGTLPWSVADRMLARAPGAEVLVLT